MTNYNDGLWHVWQGSKCPVHPKSVVSVCTIDARSGASNGKGMQIASEYDWGHEGNMFPIVAFRVVKEYREPREWWLAKGVTYTHAYEDLEAAQTYERCNRGVEIIHVREVVEGGDA